MKNGVQDDVYYFLLDWKDRNLQEFQDIKGVGTRLCDLTPYELNIFYSAIMAEQANHIISIKKIMGENPVLTVKKNRLECVKSPNGEHKFVPAPDSFDLPYCKYCYKEN